MNKKSEMMMMNLRKPIFNCSVFINLFCFFILLFLLLQGYISPVDGYDTLDPHGNITIKWDILSWPDDSYNAQVSIYNFQLYRHIERPGWRLSWRWKEGEWIWGMLGAEATEQGDCSKIKRKDLPHSCMKKPVIIDLLPGAPYNLQTANCCKAGVLSTKAQDPTKYGSTFQLSVGNLTVPYENVTVYENGTEPIHPPQINETKLIDLIIPEKFSLGIPGYTCAEPLRVSPSKFDVDGGRRHTQALFTWNITCTYSQTLASKSPTCCVSLSAFYNETIVPCPKCSCACHEQQKHCVDPDNSSLIELPHGDEDKVVPPLVRCSQHMCPIKVHWHVKTSYKDYWRVKMTVNNFNYVKNYTQWSLVVKHPNLESLERIFSFNYKPLNQYSIINDTGMFWGIQYYNDMLLQSGESGNVQTEMLLRKDPGVFRFSEGWAFPRKISFNGDICVMPPPDEYPKLPNSSFSLIPIITTPFLFSLLFSLTLLIIL